MIERVPASLMRHSVHDMHVLQENIGLGYSQDKLGRGGVISLGPLLRVRCYRPATRVEDVAPIENSGVKGSEPMTSRKP